MSKELRESAIACKQAAASRIEDLALAELVMRIADDVLERHPADEDEPITEEWLIENGFNGDALGLELRDEDAGWAICKTHEHSRWDYMGRYIKSPETRGDVRRLCAALGLELRGVSSKR